MVSQSLLATALAVHVIGVTVAADMEIPVIPPLGEAPDNADGPNRFLFYMSSDGWPIASAVGDSNGTRVPHRPNRFLFYMSSGLATQARVLVDECAKYLSKEKRFHVAVVTRDESPFSDLMSVVKDQFVGTGAVVDAATHYAPDAFSPSATARAIRHADAVVFLGPSGDCSQVLRETATFDTQPNIYLLGFRLSPGGPSL